MPGSGHLRSRLKSGCLVKKGESNEHVIGNVPTAITWNEMGDTVKFPENGMWYVTWILYVKLLFVISSVSKLMFQI